MRVQRASYMLINSGDCHDDFHDDYHEDMQ